MDGVRMIHSRNYSDALHMVTHIIDHMLENNEYSMLGYYNGVFDICSSRIDFQDMAENFDLSEEEYEDLIEFSQQYVERRSIETV